MDPHKFAPCGCSSLELMIGFAFRVVLLGAALSRDGMVSTMYLIMFLLASASSPMLVRRCLLCMLLTSSFAFCYRLLIDRVVDLHRPVVHAATCVRCLIVSAV